MSRDPQNAYKALHLSNQNTNVKKYLSSLAKAQVKKDFNEWLKKKDPRERSRAKKMSELLIPGEGHGDDLQVSKKENRFS